jgi:hypothetical protein
MNVEPKRQRWRQFTAAVGLLPLSLLMWWFGLVGAWSDRPELSLGRLIWGLILILSPCVALTGVIWLLVLIARLNWPSASSEHKSQNGG